MRNRVEILGQIRVHYISVAAADQRVDFLDCVKSTPSRAIAVGTGIEVRLEDRLKYQLGSGLHRRSRIVGIPSGRSPLPPGFGIITLRTGAGRYVFSCSSFLMPDSHSSSPSASTCSNVTPSTPGAPLLACIRS